MKALGVIVSVWLVGWGAVPLSWAAGPVHDFAGRCENCHLGQTGSGEQIFVATVDSLCRDCHEMALVNSHPSDMVVERRLPAEFTLDMEGRMTCTTCHNPCQQPAPDNPHLLRGYSSVEGFCGNCHQGAGACSDANVLFELTHAKAWTPPSADGVIDEVSRDCIACHDESGEAPAASYSIHRSAVSSSEGRDAIHDNHPIGQDYARIAAGNPRLRSIDDLSPMVSLLEGKVGCATCHSPYSQQNHFLVFSNRGSALCQECHLL